MYKSSLIGEFLRQFNDHSDVAYFLLGHLKTRRDRYQTNFCVNFHLKDDLRMEFQRTISVFDLCVHKVQVSWPHC